LFAHSLLPVGCGKELEKKKNKQQSRTHGLGQKLFTKKRERKGK